MSSQPNQFQNLEISDGRPPTARVQQHNGSIVNNNNKSTDLQTENKRLKIIVWMFSLVAILAIGGLVAAVVVAIRQSNKASNIQQQQQQQTQAPQKPQTVIYYFNDDEKDSDGDTGGIVDPVEVDSENDGFGSTTASGVVIITPEDLMTDPPVAPGVLPNDDPLGI